jgi:hypothetical protein
MLAKLSVAIPLSESIERYPIKTEIENLLNLSHPMIALLIGFEIMVGVDSD